MKMEILEKINFRQTRYMLPAILYIPLPGGPYFIFDLFHTCLLYTSDAADE